MTRARGFTLIEVLVALGIAAIGLSAVLTIVTNTARTAGSLRQSTFANWVAANRVTEVRLQTTMPSVDRTTGDTELAGAKWRWEQTVTQTQVPGMRRIDVRVRLADAPEDAVLATVTGFVGRAQLAAPQSPTSWDGASPGPGQPGQPGQPGAPGTPATPGTPTLPGGQPPPTPPPAGSG